MRQQTKSVALGGIFAALAVLIMTWGTLIPLATFICPMLCILMMRVVLRQCGTRMAWAWYGAVSLLSLMLTSDREAAVLFCFLGYYPIIKPWIDGLKWSNVAKLIFFNGVILFMYWMLMNLFGLEAVIEEYRELGTVTTVITLILGNMTFFMLDLILSRKWKWQGKYYE